MATVQQNNVPSVAKGLNNKVKFFLNVLRINAHLKFSYFSLICTLTFLVSFENGPYLVFGSSFLPRSTCMLWSPPSLSSLLSSHYGMSLISHFVFT